MKKYKVESMVFYSKTFVRDREHILKASNPEIQATLDRYARDGWRLASTDAANFGMAIYFYLYFEKDA